jgi:hypothetical protein
VLRLPTGGLSNLSPALTKLFSGIDYLAVKTATNYLYSSETLEDLSGFQTTCPSRFVVPDDKSHPRNHWIAGSGCARPCRYNITWSYYIIIVLCGKELRFAHTVILCVTNYHVYTDILSPIRSTSSSLSIYSIVANYRHMIILLLYIRTGYS